jgi:hypothetical protein
MITFFLAASFAAILVTVAAATIESVASVSGV